MNAILLSVAGVLAGLVLLLLVLALLSRSGQAPGLQGDRLADCGGAPNCVSSEAGTATSHVVQALPLPAGRREALMEQLRAAVVAQGGRIVRLEPGYLAASFHSRLFGFVDDLELRLDEPAGVVQVRSASRVGYSDGGVNRKRVKGLRARLRSGLDQ